MEKQTEQFNNYRIVAYSTALINDFYKLYTSVHGPIFSKEYFLAKASTEFTGQPVIGFIAYEQSTNEVAAFYGVYPVLVQLQNQPVLAAQSADTLTHANHRRRGLFEKLFDLTKEESKKRHVQFIFGFPNSNSAPGFKKFGWEFYPRRKNFYIRSERTLAGKIRNKLFPDASANWLERNKVDQEKIDASGFQSDVMRNGNYFNYKHTLSGAKFYKLATCIIWAKMQPNTLVIGDVKTDKNLDLAKIAAELASLPAAFNLNNLYFSLSHFNLLAAELEKKPGISVSESEFIVYPLSNTSGLEQLKYSSADEDTF